jgi:hypothetical protein
MIDRVASNMLGEVPWPPTVRQGVNIGIALAEVGAAMWLWGLATKGKSLSLKPWQLRGAAVLSGAAALWAISHVRTTTAPAPAPPPIQPQARPSQVDWSTLV